MKKYVGFVGWRGMVGSVLLARLSEENDFNSINPVFFSTSQVGEKSPMIKGISRSYLKNAYDIKDLKDMHIIVTCQGAEYTNIVYHKLRSTGWQGYWLDAASLLRMKNDSVIVLDPINISYIKQSIEKGIKTFIGSNCTVSLMMLALGGLFHNNMIDWITFSTYQAASGAGSNYIVELLQQMGGLYNSVSIPVNQPASFALIMEKTLSIFAKSKQFPTKYFSSPLAGNVLPWIDSAMPNNQTREEWKVEAEVNKILNSPYIIPIDGTCVRVGTFRCHSQSFVIKLKQDISCSDIIEIIKQHNPWVKIIPNNFQATMQSLTPLAVTGTLDIAVGRMRKLNIGSKYLSIFTVGDQLLWGAAEPIRRMLMILLKKII